MTTSEAEATLKAMHYWVDRWDWECPVLFGGSLEEVRTVVAEWPPVASSQDPQPFAFAFSAWRELLYGASAISKSRMTEVTGIDAAEAELLWAKFQRLANELDGVEGK